MRIATVPFAALALIAAGCGPHPSDEAPGDVQTRWRAAEEALRTEASHLPALVVPAARGSFDLATLKMYAESERHGADDQRKLSRYDSAAHRVVSDGPLARIVAVRSIEYKSLADFGAGAFPIAIITVSDSVGYPKLGLKPGTNWWIVKYDAATKTWQGWIQPPSGPAVPLATTAMGFDKVEPVSAARFVWDAADESLWGLCGGKCCTSKGPALR